MYIALTDCRIQVPPMSVRAANPARLAAVLGGVGGRSAGGGQIRSNLVKSGQIRSDQTSAGHGNKSKHVHAHKASL